MGTGGYTPAAPFFHLTRIVHMADSCANCGQCSDVCPCEIPVAKVWSTVNNKVKGKSTDISQEWVVMSLFHSLIMYPMLEIL